MLATSPASQRSSASTPGLIGQLPTSGSPDLLEKPHSPDLKLLDSLRPLRRTKRRWVITTLELEEEDKGPFPKFIGQIHFDVANRETGEIVDRSLLFNVKINDINDNAPEFPEKEYNITMTEKQSRVALGLLLWCSAASGTKKGHLSIPYEVGNQSLIQYNEESKHVLSQDVPDVGIKVTSPPEQPYISKEITQVAKGNPGMDLTKSSELSNQMNGMIGSPATADDVLPPIPAWEQVTLRLQRNKMHWVVPHSQIMETVGGILNQKLEHVSNLEDNVDSYLPRAYAEEGHLEASGSAWSLPFANDDDSLPPDFLDSLGPRFAMLGRVCSK
ncbi:hypothetical protein JRQ81_014290 [Phrynocephalus forsythii]|uniref:Cadherin domain-containing protein n=1 Tax=Phrynocephalus forsythii TaxID=171643 RepID=A0A9Q0XYC1_9SAUR|nr:hypothetical protein JRQ81_014290 [Phrynocephalus forsythii]